MEEEVALKKAPAKRTVHTPPAGTAQLWCGKVQGLCEGNICISCHLFPGKGPISSVTDSIIDSITLTDHKKVGMTKEEDQED